MTGRGGEDNLTNLQVYGQMRIVVILINFIYLLFFFIKIILKYICFLSFLERTPNPMQHAMVPQLVQESACAVCKIFTFYNKFLSLCVSHLIIIINFFFHSLSLSLLLCFA